MKYLITSATGDLAGKAVKHLMNLVPTSDIIVTARSKEKAQHLIEAGIEVREADFTNIDSLVKAFSGVDRVLFISSNDVFSRIEQHENVVAALKTAAVGYVVYTSAPKAQTNTLVLAPDHKHTEQLIEASGLDYSFARNNWYIENEAMAIQAAKNGAPFSYAASTGKVGYALKEDYAEAAARILAGVAPQQKIYELGGTPVSYADIAKMISEVTGNEVQTAVMTDEDYTQLLVNVGLPQPVAELFAVIQSDIREGALDYPSKDLENVLGRKQTPLTVYIEAL